MPLSSNGVSMTAFSFRISPSTISEGSATLLASAFSCLARRPFPPLVDSSGAGVSHAKSPLGLRVHDYVPAESIKCGLPSTDSVYRGVVDGGLSIELFGEEGQRDTFECDVRITHLRKCFR